MLYPSIDELKKRADSRYTLVMMASKRSRDLIDGYPPLVDIGISKPVSIATEEIARDMISYTRDPLPETEEEMTVFSAVEEDDEAPETGAEVMEMSMEPDEEPAAAVMEEDTAGDVETPEEESVKEAPEDAENE